MIAWDDPLIDNSLRDEDQRLVARLHEMQPHQLRRFACDAAALALERASLDDPAIHAALAVARTIGTPDEPPPAQLAALRAEMEQRFDRLDQIQFDTGEAYEAGLGPTYQDFLAAIHLAVAAETVTCALCEDPREAAVLACTTTWASPPRVVLEDFLRAADLALST